MSHRTDSGRAHSVTLEQVARHAGVSLATASRALNGAGGRPVRQELKERVLASALALSYTPNAHAQALVSGTADVLGLVTHDVSDPYFASIARGAMRVAMDSGVLVMLASTFRDPERELAYVSTLRAQRARGVLLIGSGFNDPVYGERMHRELDAFARSGGRVAFVSQHHLPFDTVLPDNEGGGAAAARALLELGHREFGLVTGPERLTTITDRVGGFRRALAEQGGRLDPSQCVEAEFSQEGGYQATRELLARGRTATALFCVSDVMAVGALQALREARVRVPQDLSVLGFDDIPVVRQLTPALSTIALPLEEMGEAAVTLALGEPSDSPRVHPAPFEVVLRETTRPPSRGGLGRTLRGRKT